MAAPKLLRLWYPQSESPEKKRLLTLLSWSSNLYLHLLRRDQRKAACKQLHLPAHVLSVGNLVVGGTGKTPFTLWLASQLHNLGHRIVIVSRGYARRGDIVSRVPAATDRREKLTQSANYGDEPVLMARKLDRIPVWVGRKRWQAGMLAIEKDHPEIIILDDGFQHLSLYRDLDFVLLDVRNPFGNERLLPLGPLREPVGHLKRANAIILTHADDPGKTQQTLVAVGERFPGKPIFCCRHVVSAFRFGLSGAEVPLRIIQSQPSIAFAGIAHPDAFFSALQGLGITLADKFAFPDHHPYQSMDLLRLLQSRSRHNSQFLITTQKDAVRLPSEFQETVLTAELELEFGTDAGLLLSYIENKLST